MPIRDQNAINERKKKLLDDKSLNGVDFVLVTLDPIQHPTKAILEVHFSNDNNFDAFIKDPDFKKIFTISGGHRVLAGTCTGQVQVTDIKKGPDTKSLNLYVAPIGDYSTYTLIVNNDKMDPIFNDINFKFRPGCFNIDCSPEWTPADKPTIDPVIDYLSKDYDSFRHTLITAMMERIPGWQPTSEADLSVVLLDLFSAAADELSDYQDRVMNEAYLNTARKRVSLARHARLMDYHIHQGNQASTWLALDVNQAVTIPKVKNQPFEAWTGNVIDDPLSVVFITKEDQDLHPALSKMRLYTWDYTIPTLKAGDTSAYLSFDNAADATTVCNWINEEKIKHILIQEWLNPDTGEASGRDPKQRQLLKLLDEGKGAQVVPDPMHPDAQIVQVFWEEKDKLQSNYCFTVNCSSNKVPDVSLFHGNLLQVFQGAPQTSIFVNKDQSLVDPNHFHYEQTELGTICILPAGPLAYMPTQPGGDVPPKSTLEVAVQSEGATNYWKEVPNLIHSKEDDTHFVVETDENGWSVIRFGNGINGMPLPGDAIVTCIYQIGRGPDGNIGADKLKNFDNKTYQEISSCWNPFDVTSGQDQEPVEQIIRRVPEAYRLKQLRAVTLKDYVNMVEQIPGVAQAAARYAWTGSWRTVQIAVNPLGTCTLDDNLKGAVVGYLDAVKLIGEDYEIRPPEYVPLEIHVVFCVHPDYWPKDVKAMVEQEFSNGYTADGRMGFFHPDLWTFGQDLRASQIVGRVQWVQGVDYVVSVQMNRWNESTPGTPDVIKVRPNEIIQVINDPDHMEKGFIDFTAEGGRQ
jgi:hypothetical protein